MVGIIVVGLGPGYIGQITRDAWDEICDHSEIWTTLGEHAVLSDLPQSVTVRSLHERSPGAGGQGDLEGLAARILELGRRPQGVVVALPGHPLVDDPLGTVIVQIATDAGMDVRVIDGQSCLGLVVARLPSESRSKLSVWEAGAVSGCHVPPFPPDVPALLWGSALEEHINQIQAVLQATYPPLHEVILVSVGDEVKFSPRPLRDMSHPGGLQGACYLYVPPLAEGHSLEAMQEVVAHLRAPDGCPWDRQQTHQSLRRNMLEEAYEAVSAMDAGDSDAIREELGDLLLQIMLNSQISAEAGDFGINDVSRGIREKIVRRHPHVFGDLQLHDVDGVLANWEKLKEDERARNGGEGGLLGGVSSALPALNQAQEYQERAARVGFDWPEVGGILEKIAEEIAEVRGATDATALEAEFGDLLFSLVNFIRWKNIDAESALRSSNRRFKQRFGFIEESARQQGRRLSDLSLQEMDDLWNQAKVLG